VSRDEGTLVLAGVATTFAPDCGGPEPITEREFALFRQLIFREAGICLSRAKKALLMGRLARRLRDLGLRSYGDYYRHVVRSGEPERIRLLDSICTNETHFFREPRQFEFLEQEVFPRWAAEGGRGARPRRIRAWSAGCSTGEEPYSLAMALLARFPLGLGWEIEIVASDLSTRALDAARAGVWPLEKAAAIPTAYLRAFMLKGQASQHGLMKAGPEIRALVRFYRLNLNDEIYAVGGLFDLILCRNVLIYFDAASKGQVIHRLLRHLARDGYLLLGHAESLSGLNEQTRSVVPTVYAWKDGDRRKRLRSEGP